MFLTIFYRVWKLYIFHFLGDHSSSGTESMVDTISPGENMVVQRRIDSIASGSQRSSSNRHRSNEYEDIFLGSSKGFLLSRVSRMRAMRNFFPIISDSDTTPERETSWKLQEKSEMNMVEYSLERNPSLWNSQEYDDIRARQYLLSGMVNPISHGIRTSKKYSRDTITGERMRSSMRKKKQW